MNEDVNHDDLAPPPEPAAASSAGGKPSPGERVRAARERAGYSQEQLAALTKLTRQTIAALERDDFANLLEPVYVRGYYRKCAKVLALPEQELVNVYEALVRPPPPSLPSKVRLATGDNLEAGRRLPLRFSVLAPVLAVAVSAAVWFWRGESKPPPAVEPAPVAVEAQPAAPAPQTAAAPSAGEPIAATTDAGTATPPPSPATAASTISTTPDSPRLLLSLQAESWVRINDSQGKSLLSGLKPAGTLQVIEGTPPYSLVIGDVTGVRIEFQGQVIDPKVFSKGGTTARFTLPVKP